MSDPKAPGAPPRVELRDITKRFPGVVANADANLVLQAGEIHALLGENGAGKTTLMNALGGHCIPDSGEIFVNGRLVEIRTPEDAAELGVGMVHQHFRLVDNLTVAENVYLGWQVTPWHVSRETLAQRLEQLVEEVGFAVDVRAEIWQLSVGAQQRVEILRSLVRGADILILDEPTAVLTPDETTELFAVLRRFASEGKAIVFISHKLYEVLEVSDRVTVMRNGTNVATLDTSVCDRRSLAELMVGKAISDDIRAPTRSTGDRVLGVRGVGAIGDRGLRVLVDVDLDVHSGEIVGIAGVSGNGQAELVDVLTGLRRPSEGEVWIGDREMTGARARAIADAGVGHIPADRRATGMFAELSLTHNAALREYRSPPIRRGLRFVKRAAERLAQDIVSEGDVRASHVEAPMGTLSGGNQQKVVVQREQRLATRLLVAAHPTRGLDVAASQAVRNSLRAYRDDGGAVLLVSADLDEVMTVSDRIMVMFEGRIVGEMPGDSATREELGLMMGGEYVESASG